MQRLVTVTTLTYKKFELLFNAIDSVLNQDYPYIEYIISDDGSPDFPEKEIREYVEKNKKENIVNLQILLHDKNYGTVRNDNDAFRHATGEIVIPVSADDSLYDNTVISKIVNIYNERDCDCLCVARALYDEKGRFVRFIPSKKEADILTKLKNNREQYQRFVTWRFFDAFSGSTLSLKREFIEKWGYWDERYTLLEDAPFFAQYLWDNNMECAFDIIGLKYNEGGVSSGEKHPQLIADDELFRRTDRIKHINELRFLEREIIKYSLTRTFRPNLKQKIKAVITHPIGYLGNKAYAKTLKQLND